ncbi:hypothetical protein [Methylomonas fluvii]|uniref:Uncharacterized protein n=1 Tax=Methylomonas fluvii TaxID=1854564 RepID=A0ABR9DH74_9GAMM|nr:hypothetical protein [Methylomonas fluvii]MBD9362141.1 hypothetical protein [Methylomonas fluvii]
MDFLAKQLVCGAYQLQPLSAGGLLSNPMKELAKTMLVEALEGKKKGQSPADLVIVIDDVELENLGRENVIAEHFQAAVNNAIQLKAKGISAEESRIRSVIRDKCSFHLLKPMVEAYLFGDTVALGLAGVPTEVIPKLVHQSDVEKFETNDPKWLPTCRIENTKKANDNKLWWLHERHPKAYLDYLLPKEYSETTHGLQALIKLNWPQVPKCQHDIPIFGSLFQDVADWFNIANPITGATHPDFYPTKTSNRANLLLRNM